MSTTKIICLSLILCLAPAALAQDAIFTNSTYSSPNQPNEVDILLVISDSNISIKTKKVSAKKKGIDIEIPFASIDTLSHERAVSAQWGTAGPAGSVGGLIATKSSYISQWLEIDSHDGDTKQVTVIHLDRSEYQAILDALKSKSGKPIVEAAPGPNAIDPSADSQDVDHVIPYSVEAVSAALKPAMESMGCNITRSDPGRIECKRARATSMSELNGVGGEKVTALLESQGASTRVQISTGKGFEGHMNKRNWSTPIYDALLSRLKTPPAVPPASPRD